MLGNSRTPRRTLSYTSAIFQTCFSFKQAKCKKLSIFWHMTIIIITVLCNRLFYYIFFLTRCTDYIRRDEERKERRRLLEAASVFLRSQNNCQVIINETFKSDWLSKWFSYHSAKYGLSQVALVVKNSLASARDIEDMGLIPELGRSPGGGHGNPLQCSCLENPMDRGAWQTTVHRVEESDMKRLKMNTQRKKDFFLARAPWIKKIMDSPFIIILSTSFSSLWTPSPSLTLQGRQLTMVAESELQFST